MNSVEEAYQVIADNLVDRAGMGWTQVVFETAILGRNCSSMATTEFRASNAILSLSLGISAAFAIDDACIFLRDDLLKTTGQRIWGLTFTLFPDGKFRIEYNYDKPEGYEETDETLDVDLSSDIPGQSSVQ